MAKQTKGMNPGISKGKALTLGRVRFAKISAVEGIILTPAMTRRAAEFDRQGLSAAERRAAIKKAHSKG